MLAASATSGVFRTAGNLLFKTRSMAEVVTIMTRARDRAPMGRHKVVLTRTGVPILQWDDGQTTLEGQGVLPLDEDHASLDDLFEAASIAEANNELDKAARLYDLCGRADRRDPIAPYNLANIRLGQGRSDEAALAYQQAPGPRRPLRRSPLQSGPGSGGRRQDRGGLA
ncbi:MAG: hypothetical protein WDM85_06905 [Caulobacteraceae bacterium]